MVCTVKIQGGSLAVANMPARILNYSNDKLLFVVTMYLRISSTWYNEVTFADYDVSFNTRHMYHAMIQNM